MAVTDITPPKLMLRLGECFRTIRCQQMPVEPDHERPSGLVVYRPKTCQHILASSTKKCSCDSDKFVSTGRHREVALAQSGLAGAERDEAGMQPHAGDLVQLQPSIILLVRLKLNCR